MTPKEQYEARKAERKARQEKPFRDHNAENEIMEDLLDRCVTAFERIADALENLNVKA